MKCLLCGSKMKTNIIEGVEIDHCITCGGVWLDGGELEELTGHSLKDQRVLDCPYCNKPMQIRTIGPVEVDFCRHCGGIWLDKGELEGISKINPDQGGINEKFDNFKDSLEKRRNLEIAKMSHQIQETGSGSAFIDDVFVMYKDGLLISCSTKHEKPEVDEDILASTLMTIQDFVQVSFGNMGESQLQSIRFGQKEILIERGDHIVTAMVATSNMPSSVKVRVQDVIKKIEEKYSEYLDRWDGNLSSFDGIKEFIEEMYK